MVHEEKTIKGVLCWRCGPRSKWREHSQKSLARTHAKLNKKIARLAAENERLKEALKKFVIDHDFCHPGRHDFNVEEARLLLAELAVMEKEEVKDG